MTTRQTFALSNPVRNPADTQALMKFSKTVTNEDGRFGTILSVESSEGWFKWHVSITVLSEEYAPIDWDDLKERQRAAVRNLGLQLLADVGHHNSDAVKSQ